MDDRWIIFIALVAVGALGLGMGGVIEGTMWRSDCTQINAHVSAGKVFKCEEKK